MKATRYKWFEVDELLTVSAITVIRTLDELAAAPVARVAGMHT